MCKAARYGCNTTDTTNYDPLATVGTDCYPYVYGCLNPGAVNFRCTSTSFSAPCALEVGSPTFHYKDLCRWTNDPAPPPPPLPPSPPENEFTVVQEIGLTLAIQASVAEVEAMAEDYKTWFRNNAGLDADAEVTLVVI